MLLSPSTLLPRFSYAFLLLPSGSARLLHTLVFARLCGDDQFAAGKFSPSLDMSR